MSWRTPDDLRQSVLSTYASSIIDRPAREWTNALAEIMSKKSTSIDDAMSVVNTILATLKLRPDYPKQISFEDFLERWDKAKIREEYVILCWEYWEKTIDDDWEDFCRRMFAALIDPAADEGDGTLKIVLGIFKEEESISTRIKQEAGDEVSEGPFWANWKEHVRFNGKQSVEPAPDTKDDGRSGSDASFGESPGA